ncbi:unnamed protein product, partial [Mesorhabditis spiculigera]
MFDRHGILCGERREGSASTRDDTGTAWRRDGMLEECEKEGPPRVRHLWYGILAFLQDPYIPTAPTTPNGNWPDSVGSVLHSPVSPGFFALFDAYKKSIEPLAMPSPTYVRDANHQYPDDWRITIATAPTTTTAMTTEATHGTNPTRLIVTEPSWSDEGWVQSRVFVLCLVALFVLTVYFKNKKYEPPPPVSWLETSTPEDAQRPDAPQNPAKPPDDTVKSAKSSAIV